MRTIMLVLLVIVGFAAPAVAETEEPTAQSPAKQSRVVCKKEMVIGSRIPKRVCRTQRGAAADRDHARRTVQEARQMGATMGSGSFATNPTGPRGR